MHVAVDLFFEIILFQTSFGAMCFKNEQNKNKNIVFYSNKVSKSKQVNNNYL
jgi:hypothetical protein